MLLINKGCNSMYADYIGDGYCDDENNIEDCQFDSGDCCGPDVFTDYCLECICYETSLSSTTTVGPEITNEEGNFFHIEGKFPKNKLFLYMVDK